MARPAATEGPQVARRCYFLGGSLAKSASISDKTLSVIVSGEYCCTDLSVMERAMSIWSLVEKPGMCLSSTARAAGSSSSVPISVSATV